MASYVKTLADAVVAALSAAGSGMFSQAFTAYFDFDPRFEEITVAEGAVVVVHLGTSEFSPEARSQDRVRDNILVSILYNVADADSGNDEDRIDAGVELLEEIRFFFRQKQIYESVATGAIYLGGESVNRGDLDQRMFRQTVQLTFDSYRGFA